MTARFLALWLAVTFAGLALIFAPYIVGYNRGAHNGCVEVGGDHCSAWRP